MRYARALWLAGALSGCTLFGDVDDLTGAKPDASSSGSGGNAGSTTDAAADAAGGGGTSACTPATQCLGCPSCSEYCQCATPFDFDQCMAECGSGGADAGNDSAAGAAGAAGGDNCSDASLHGAKCTEADAWGSAACTSCMRTQCCTELESCFAEEQCARFWSCYTAHCQSAGDISCASSECGGCFSVGPLTQLSQCIADGCSAECSL